jgi:hypothetical protein
MLKYSTVHFDNGINCKEWLGRAALPLLQFWTLPSQIIICSESYEKQAQKKNKAVKEVVHSWLQGAGMDFCHIGFIQLLQRW